MKFRRLRQVVGFLLLMFISILLMGMIYVTFMTALEYIFKFILWVESKSLLKALLALTCISAFYMFLKE